MLYFGTIITDNNAVKLHEKPSVCSKTLLSIPKNEMIVITEETDGWSKAIYNSKIGYIMSNFIKKSTDLISIDKSELKALANELKKLSSIINEVI